jgi:hypothetical protein
VTEADKKYMERKQKDWEFDEPEPSDYAMFVNQLKGIIAWLIVMVGFAMIVASVVVK